MTCLAQLPNSRRIVLATKKIAPQFPNTLEGRLMLAVLVQALRDAYDARAQVWHKRQALRYLMGTIHCCEICAVDSDWVRMMIRRVGLPLPVTDDEFVRLVRGVPA